MGLARVFRAGMWLYVSQLIYYVSGFIYWLIVGALVGPGVLGEASAAIGTAMTFAGLAGLGLGRAAARFIGAGDLGTAAWALRLLPLLSAIGGASALIAVSLMGMPPSMAIVAALTAALSLSANVLSGFARGMLETRPVALGTALGHVAKVVVGALLVTAGLGALGVAAGYMARHLVALAVLAVFAASSLKLGGGGSLRELLAAGLAGYLPGLVRTLGNWLGVIVLYGGVGAVETGLFYVASTLAGVVAGVPTAVLSLMMPYLSGLKSGRGEAAEKALRLSLAAAMPLAAVLIAYPEMPLMLLRREYLEAAPILRLLLAPLPLATYNMVVGSLLYASAMYRLVAIRGVVTNLVSTLLYYPLALSMDGIGVAIARVAGVLVNFTLSILFGAKAGFKPSPKRLALTCAAPLAPSLALAMLGAPAWIGVPVAIALSVIAYARLGVVRREELRAVYRTLPTPLATRLYPLLRPLVEAIYD
ncbi:MAG: oligosaccharide flippase family protein [Thermoproteales archaeon]|nr:oligosaccharide flippase family protein [Thermoproteales archaeon]